MSHSSELRWAEASQKVSQQSLSLLASLNLSEDTYQELLESYNFVGATDQLFADQLFKEVIAARKVPGVQAVITVDVVLGFVENPILTNAGTGYLDGFGFNIALVVTAGGGDGLASLTYDVVGGALVNLRLNALGATYTDGPAQPVLEVPAPTVGVPDTVANADELGQVADLRIAIIALHELWLAMNNGITATADRAADLRRMS